VNGCCMWLKRRATREEMCVVSVCMNGGFDVDTYSAVREVIGASDPSFFKYSPGRSFGVYFHYTVAERANMLAGHLRMLRERDERFAGMGVGVAAGELVYEVDWRKRIIDSPMGQAVNEAARAAATDMRVS